MTDLADMNWSDTLLTPEPFAAVVTSDVDETVNRLIEIYDRNSGFIQLHFKQLLEDGLPTGRVRACYPYARLTTTGYTRPDSRSSFGFVAGPGTYQTTLSRPDLFREYLLEQFTKLIENHGVGIEIGESDSPIPLHFAFPEGMHVEGGLSQRLDVQLREVFDVPDLAVTDDAIANGEFEASRCHWQRFRPSGWIIRCTGWLIIRLPVRRIFRILCCSPTTSSTLTSFVRWHRQ